MEMRTSELREKGIMENLLDTAIWSRKMIFFYLEELHIGCFLLGLPSFQGVHTWVDILAHGPSSVHISHAPKNVS
ncbi:unnamed protein product, partial [Gulo gulo]